MLVNGPAAMLISSAFPPNSANRCHPE